MKSYKIFYFTYTIYLIFTTLTLLEIYLRIFDPLGAEIIFEARRHEHNFQIANPIYAKHYVPNSKDTFQGAEVRINSSGFRGEEIQLDQSKQRVMLLGDSIVFGWGVPEEFTLAPLLQSLNSNYYFFNISELSWNTRNQYEFINIKAKEFKPDIIIWIIVDNDILPSKQGKTFIDKKQLLQRNYLVPKYIKITTDFYKFLISKGFYSAIYFLRPQRIKFKTIELQNMYKHDAPSWKDTENALINLILFCRNNNIEIKPFLFGDTEQPTNVIYQQMYKHVFDTHNVKVNFFPKELYKKDYKNSFIDRHPNIEGQKIMANYINKILQQ